MLNIVNKPRGESIAVFSKMRTGYRSALLLNVICLLFVSSACSAALAKRDGSQSTSVESAFSDAGNVTAAKPQTPDADLGCEPGTDVRKSDLCAQWKAADAAKVSADWTERTFYLGVGGALIGFFTLVAAALAAGYAKQAAKETERGAVAAVETLKSARAWILFDTVFHGGITNSADNRSGQSKFIKDGIHIAVQWINSGQSPALNVEALIDYKLIGLDGVIPTFIPTWKSDGNGTIGMNNKFLTDDLFIDDETTKQFRSGNIKIIVYSAVRYTDVFSPSEQRLSQSCLSFLHYGGQSIDAQGVATEKINIAPVGKQNRVS